MTAISRCHFYSVPHTRDTKRDKSTNSSIKFNIINDIILQTISLKRRKIWEVWEIKKKLIRSTRVKSQKCRAFYVVNGIQKLWLFLKNEFYSCLLLFHSEKSFGWKLEDIYPKQENFSWLPYLGKRKNHEK